MENYEKGETQEVDDGVDLEFAENVIHMRVMGGSKTRNLMGYAMTKLKVQLIKLTLVIHGFALMSCCPEQPQLPRGRHVGG